METEKPKTLVPCSTPKTERDSRTSAGSLCLFSLSSSGFHNPEATLASSKRLMAAAALSIMFMCVEVYVGLAANSLAVLTDAARLFSNTALFSLSVISLYTSEWRATARASYGYFRVEILAALFSVQISWLIAGVLLYKALDRIVNYRGEVEGFVMLSVSAFGLVVNALVAALLSHDGRGRPLAVDEEEPLVKHAEVEKATAGNVEDLLRAVRDSIQTVGVTIAGALIWWKPEWQAIDTVCALVFSAISVVKTVKTARKIAGVLMEACPGEIDVKRLEKSICELDGVVSVHDIHVWAITLGKVVFTCHVSVTLEADADDVLRKVVEYIRKEYGIVHITVQVERR